MRASSNYLEAGAISGQREVEPALYERVNQGDHLAVYFLAGREKRFVIADSFSPVDHERRSGLYLALFAIGSNLFIWVPTLIWRRRDRIAEGR